MSGLDTGGGVFNAMNQGRDEKEPDICGLSFNGIPVEKAA